MWTNEEVPRGSPYNQMVDHMGYGRLMWMAWANGWLPHGPVMGCHVAVGKFPMRAQNRIFKNKKKGLPNLVAKLSTPTNLKKQLQTWRKFQTHIYFYN
jgi:hypothetical protein